MYTACFVLLPAHCSKINCIAPAMPSGLLVCLSTDPRVQDLHPQGATPAFAAPDVLRFLQKQHEGAELNQSGQVPVNGPSLDWWSVGVVLFFLLTGELPFNDEGPTVSKAPLNVPSHCRAQWEDYECVLEWQQIWVSTCSVPSDGLLRTCNKQTPFTGVAMCTLAIHADMSCVSHDENHC